MLESYLNLYNECFAEKIYIEARRVYDSGNVKGCEAKLHKVLEQNPNHRQAVYDLGILSRDSGNDVEAIKWFERAIEIDPHYPYTYFDMAISLSRLGQKEKAKECFEKAEELKKLRNSN